jgi:hypothetical protein
VQFTDGQADRLDRASAIELGFAHDFLDRPMTRQVMFGDIRLDTAS